MPLVVVTSLRTSGEHLFVTGEGFPGTELLSFENGIGVSVNENAHLAGNGTSPESRQPVEATMLSRVGGLDECRRANLFKEYLQSWRYYNLNPPAMRSAKVVSDRPAIQPDGANFTKALFYLHNEHPRIERNVIEALRALEPKVDLFAFQSPDPKWVFMFMVDAEGHLFGMDGISDGTLRYLAMAHIIHGLAAKTSTLARFAPLIIIEEPENGLYVGHLRTLFDKIDPTGAAGQFVFTSHNPYFIDMFEKNLDGVHVLKPGNPSAVLSKLDVQRTSKDLEEMHLGELHFREMLS